MNKFFQLLLFIIMLETLMFVSQVDIAGFEPSGILGSMIAAGPSGFSASEFWDMLVSAFQSLSGIELAAGAIFIGAAIMKGDLVFAAVIGLAMMTVIPDLNLLYNLLAAIHPIIAFIIVMPIMIIMMWTIFEWMRTPLA